MAHSMDGLKIGETVQSLDVRGCSRGAQRLDVVDLPQRRICERQAADRAFEIVARRYALLHERCHPFSDR